MEATATSRYDRIDALRGAAIVWMTAYHFCFDLNWFGWWPNDFYQDPLWTWQRTAIVSLFLFCAGLGQAVAAARGQRWPRFWRRWAQVAGCAVLVTIGSYVAFPASYIYFGVLHGIALMLIVVRLTAGWGAWLWPAGATVIVLPLVAQALHAGGHLPTQLDGAGLNWLGLISQKPNTEDYVPLAPWLGVMWWGMASGQWLLGSRQALVGGAVAGPARALAWMGRWSLSWYMLHQPVMIGAMAGLKLLLGS